MGDFKRSLEELKAVNSEYENYKAALFEAKEEFNIKYSKLIESIKEKEQEITNKKVLIEAMAKDQFLKTGEKKLLGGIGIREKKMISYDLKKAEAFAKEKNMFMIFDSKSFEKAATSLNLDFVSESTVTQVTFPNEIIL